MIITANTTLDQTQNTADAQSYMQLLSSGKVTDHAANEVDEAQAHAGHSAGTTGADSRHGRSDHNDDGHSHDDSALNFSAISPAENTAASVMGDNASPTGPSSTSEYQPEQIMTMLAQAINPEGGQASATTTGAQSADATSTIQLGGNSSPLGNLDALQIATEGLSEFSQGFQQLSQADSTNSQAAQTDLQQAQLGLEVAQLGLNLYQLDNQGNAASADTSDSQSASAANPGGSIQPGSTISNETTPPATTTDATPPATTTDATPPATTTDATPPATTTDATPPATATDATPPATTTDATPPATTTDATPPATTTDVSSGAGQGTTTADTTGGGTADGQSTSSGTGSATGSQPSAGSNNASSTDRLAGYSTHWGQNGAAYADPVSTIDAMHAAGITTFRDNYSANNSALDSAVEEASKDGMTPMLIVNSVSDLQQAAEHYKDLGVTNIDYEYQNEPNTTYDQDASNWATNASSVASTYSEQAVQAQQALSAIAPNSELIAGAVSVAGIGWAPGDTFTTDMAQDLKNDGWSTTNSAISIHPYGGDSQGAQTTANDIQNLHNSIDSIFGQPVTLDISEVGTNQGDASTYLPQLINDVSPQQNVDMFDVYQWAGQASNNDAAYQIEGTSAEQPINQALANFASSVSSAGAAPT